MAILTVNLQLEWTELNGRRAGSKHANVDVDMNGGEFEFEGRKWRTSYTSWVTSDSDPPGSSGTPWVVCYPADEPTEQDASAEEPLPPILGGSTDQASRNLRATKHPRR